MAGEEQQSQQNMIRPQLSVEQKRLVFDDDQRIP